MATSVLDCISRIDHEELSISVLLSTPVLKNLRELNTKLTVFESCETRDFYGVSALWKNLDSYFVGYDLVFTVFGPAYFARRNTYHLFGFAQPNIIYPNNPLTASMGLLQRCRTRLKFELQAFFFARANELVVELDHVKAGLLRRRIFQRKPIHMVYNSVHSVFSEPQQWAPLELPIIPDRLRLGVISRNYSHKNLSILADVKQHLLQTHGWQVDMYVTFTPDEWQSCDAHFRSNIINVGALSLSQCPTFYEAMDGVVFPSLLECFSAVPIETMMSGRPLFASNLSFIKDVCGDHCQYFDPMDPADIAQAIVLYFTKPTFEQQRLCNTARIHAQRYPKPQERAKQYLRVIRGALVRKS